MAKPEPSSRLYRLIEAGLLARQALLVPVLGRGLEPGDDALLFMLDASGAAALTHLAAQVGLEPGLLEQRVERLVALGLAERVENGDRALRLTSEGSNVRSVLIENWRELERALFDDLPRRRRKTVGRSLKRMGKILKA